MRTNGPIKAIQDENSIEQIRDHFFGKHNTDTLKQKKLDHLVIPYQIQIIGETIITFLHTFYELPVRNQVKIFTRKQIQTAREHGILETIKPGEILIIHNKVNNLDWIADQTQPEELDKYKSLYK